MSGVHVTGFDFVFLPARSFDAAAAFYADVLGLECSARYDKIPGGEFETGSLLLQSRSTARRSTAASATWPSSRTRTGTCSRSITGTRREHGRGDYVSPPDRSGGSGRGAPPSSSQPSSAVDVRASAWARATLELVEKNAK